ncbi:SDR family oxidoreductase [Gordonia pseudamarae]|uniref:SDR family oxidoreductase n=1 Tax=Gordonia TaxID=2053 RepID=UPI00199FCDC9|nr:MULTISPECIES: SDR family oxidoreductase [Gordonia]MBD0023121.1 SDR family oxidoreductase [Gordonia sp. (in: high G+C Gram-positive bacteria)]QHN27252.1 SDR family oxidoreductase [Gordonia pseudamarae]
MNNQVVVVTGAGSMGLAIARRVAQDRTIVLADINRTNLDAATTLLTGEGYRVTTHVVDTSDPASVATLAADAAALGDVHTLIHTAGVSPNLAPAQKIIAVDLIGTAHVLEQFGKVIADGGAGVVIASQAGHMGDPLSADLADALRVTPAAELADLEFIAAIDDPGMAYGVAKRANSLRVQAESVTWADRGARLNAISPGVICTPLAIQEMDGPNRAGYENMITTSAAGRMGTPTEIAELAALLLGENGRFISGADFLIDGGVIAAIATGRYTLGG